MRTLQKQKVQEKIDYALNLMPQIKVVSTKYVKKAEGTDEKCIFLSEMNIGTSVW